MSAVDFMPLKVHILTAEAYLVGSLLIPRRAGNQTGKPPRFLDVLNNPAVFLKNPGEVASDSTILLTDGARHTLAPGAKPRHFSKLYLRLESVLLGSDEMAPGTAGTGIESVTTGAPEDLEMWMRGGLRCTGTVRGGARAILYPRADMKFIAVTGLRYWTPLTGDAARELGFAAINTRRLESVVRLADG